MKAKFGKISIGCFVATWVLTVCLISLSLSELRRFDSADVENTSLHFLFGALWIIGARALLTLGILTGLVCAIVGAVKKESPKTYYICGLVLSALHILPFFKPFFQRLF